MSPDTWRKGRRCATCGHYDEDDGCTRYEIVLPCYPGFDELDSDMFIPLDCWQHASEIGGDRR